MKRLSDLTSGTMPARSSGSRKRAVPAAFAAMALLPLPALADELSAGDTAWMLTATALVLFMTIPGLSLFYAGMVRSKNVLSVLMQCFAIASLMTVLWVLYGYSIAFGGEGAYWGGLDKMFLAGVTVDSVSGTIPETVFMTFQMTFAIITPALIVGAFAERMKFSATLWFMAIWPDVRVRPRVPLGVGRRRLARQQGHTGFCRRYRGAHQRRHGGTGCRPGAGQTQGLPDHAHDAP